MFISKKKLIFFFFIYIYIYVVYIYISSLFSTLF